MSFWRGCYESSGSSKVWFGVAATRKEGLRVFPLSLLMLIPDGKLAELKMYGTASMTTTN